MFQFTFYLVWFIDLMTIYSCLLNKFCYCLFSVLLIFLWCCLLLLLSNFNIFILVKVSEKPFFVLSWFVSRILFLSHFFSFPVRLHFFCFTFANILVCSGLQNTIFVFSLFLTLCKLFEHINITYKLQLCFEN